MPWYLLSSNRGSTEWSFRRADEKSIFDGARLHDINLLLAFKVAPEQAKNLFGDFRETMIPAEGAHPYKRDLKNLEFHLLDTGHFALEEDGDVIAGYMRRFLEEKLAAA